MSSKGQIAVISMVRNDTFFADKWISYYGSQFGYKNLYLFVDGLDQTLPQQAKKINCSQIPHKKLKRAQGDRFRARMISSFAKTLFENHKVVLAMDIDEFLILDPKSDFSLSDYLLKDFKTDSLSALGVDVGQHPELENSIDLDKPFLSQRSFAQVSDRYTKPVIAFKPITWGSGFHRVKGKNYLIDPQLFLFHFGLIDLTTVLEKKKNEDVFKSGWKGHIDRRLQLYGALQKEFPQAGDEFFEIARKKLNTKRKWYAPNKPASLKGNTIIKIPKRFYSLV